MKKEKKIHDTNEPINSVDCVNDDSDVVNQVPNEGNQVTGNEKTNAVNEIEAIKEQLEEKSKQCEQYFEKLQRSAAEFDNFRKRTAKEKEAIYQDTAAEIASSFLPVVDNFERALSAVGDADNNVKPLKDGVELVYKQLVEVMKNLGVEEIKCVGGAFDPQLHNAVMHIDDEAYEENIVVEELMKGYTLKGKVIRHSVVKVAN